MLREKSYESLTVELIIGLILASPTLYLQDICTKAEKDLGKTISTPTVCRLLARYGFRRKKSDR